MDFEDVLHMYKSGEINREEAFLEMENLEMLEINENGEVWRLAIRSGPGNKFRIITPKKLGIITGRGECSVGLYVHINGKRIGASRTRVIWTKFYGRIPKGMRISHKNGIYIDDRLSNLNIMKHGEDTSYYAEKFDIMPFGENNSQAKLTNKQCLDIYKRLYDGESVSKLAKENNVSSSNLYFIKNNLTWTKVTNPKKD